MGLWEKQKGAGDIGEQLTQAFYNANGVELTDVSGDAYYQSKDIDFLSSDGTSIEVKYDRVISRTGNLFLETNTDAGCSNTPGWFIYSEATYLFYIDGVNSKAYEINLSELRKFVRGYGCFRTVSLTDWLKSRPYVREGLALPVSLITGKEWVKTYDISRFRT